MQGLGCGLMNWGKIYISIDIRCFVRDVKMEIKNSIARSPTLETVMMVERMIEEHSGEFNRTELWRKLPKKVMWQTYLVVLDYLQSINKIAISDNGIVVYIWSPDLAKKFAKRKKY